ncbi:MAG: flagellar hook-length control protein FliK, partial [Lachnospiraceae bacterium]|nr:flagellar hook-length control protein FliK [Lachnospiraceae bacterium]
LNDKLALKQKEFEIQIEPYNLGKIAIKVAYEQNSTTISIVCSNTKTMDILAQSAKNIGSIMETNMGSPTIIFVEKNETHYLNQDHNSQTGQEHRQQNENHSKKGNEQEDNGLDFIQQLRLGLVSKMWA